MICEIICNARGLFLWSRTAATRLIHLGNAERLYSFQFSIPAHLNHAKSCTPTRKVDNQIWKFQEFIIKRVSSLYMESFLQSVLGRTIKRRTNALDQGVVTRKAAGWIQTQQSISVDHTKHAKIRYQNCSTYKTFSTWIIMDSVVDPLLQPVAWVYVN